MTRHRWKTYEGGGIAVPMDITDVEQAKRWASDHRKSDISSFEFHPADPHNGPVCIDCGYGECWHCKPEMLLEECSRAGVTAKETMVEGQEG